MESNVESLCGSEVAKKLNSWKSKGGDTFPSKGKKVKVIV